MLRHAAIGFFSKQDVVLPGTFFDDWFLPSIDELSQMHINLFLFGVGNFIDEEYWSSTEIFDEGESMGVCLSMAAGFSSGQDKSILYRVRPCRSFTANIGLYSLRDIGPSGGLIFYIDGTVYYEEYSLDLVKSVWSNIDTEIGITAQATAIGTGQANTLAIINQVGHVTSAAKLCDDLIITN